MNQEKTSLKAVFLASCVSGILLNLGCEHSTTRVDVPSDAPLDDGRSDSITSLDAATTDHPVMGYDGSRPSVVVSCRMTCSLESNGDVYCWGFDDSLNRSGSEAEQRSPRRVEGFRAIVQLGAPCSALCGVDFRGDVWCMGSNYLDKLQTGSPDRNVTVPRLRLDVRNIVQVEKRFSFLALDTSGVLYGSNLLPPRVRSLPLPASGAELSANSFGYCVVLSSGRVACYTIESTGSYDAGPALVSGLEDISHVAVGGEHACALKRDGTVWCWGDNQLGQTGVPLESSQTCESPSGIPRYCVPEPRQVADLNDVEEVSAGGRMTCVRRRDRTVWCWGDNSPPYEPSPGQGIIGDGLPNTELCRRLPLGPPEQEPPGRPCRRRPSRVARLTDVATISVGDLGSCARLISGEIWCWGVNSGQSSPVPVRVPFPAMRRDE